MFIFYDLLDAGASLWKEVECAREVAAHRFGKEIDWLRIVYDLASSLQDPPLSQQSLSLFFYFFFGLLFSFFFFGALLPFYVRICVSLSLITYGPNIYATRGTSSGGGS